VARKSLPAMEALYMRGYFCFADDVRTAGGNIVFLSVLTSSKRFLALMVRDKNKELVVRWREGAAGANEQKLMLKCGAR
jgi:hypothetical protein